MALKEREASTWKRPIRHRKGKLHGLKIQADGTIKPVWEHKVNEKAAT